MALISLAEAKEHLGISLTDTTYDNYLNRLIAAIDRLARSSCGRDFEETEYTEQVDGTGRDCVLLSRTPVTTVSSLKVNGVAVASTDYVFYPEGVIKLRYTRFSRGYKNVEVVYKAGYTDLSEIKDACLLTVEHRFRKWKAKAIHLAGYRDGELAVTFREEDIPPEARAIFDRYRKVV